MSEEQVRLALTEAARALAACSVAYELSRERQQAEDAKPTTIQIAAVSLPQPDIKPEPTADNRDVEACIVEAAPPIGQRELNKKQLAERAGYRNTSWFRDIVEKLANEGKLVRRRFGFNRAPAK